MRRSQAVLLVVSKGPERYAVPDVAGMSLDDAKAALADSHLSLGEVKQTYSETVKEGTIIGADPQAGTRLKPDATVTLLQSKGREPIDVVDWTGKPADDAVAALTKSGLQVDATELRNDDTVPKGDVISQSPNSGTLHRGDLVTLIVSKGPVDGPGPERRRQERLRRRRPSCSKAGFDARSSGSGRLLQARCRQPGPGGRDDGAEGQRRSRLTTC